MSNPVAHSPLTLLRTSEAADLEALLADGRIKPLVLLRLSPTVAVVLPEQHQALLKALKQAGHTPKVEVEP